MGSLQERRVSDEAGDDEVAPLASNDASTVPLRLEDGMAADTDRDPAELEFALKNKVGSQSEVVRLREELAELRSAKARLEAELRVAIGADESRPEDLSAVQDVRSALGVDAAAPEPAERGRGRLGRLFARPAPALVEEPPLPPEPRTGKSKSRLASLDGVASGGFGDVVLIAADLPPTPDRNSGGLRLVNLIEIFARLNRRLIFISSRKKETFELVVGSARERERYERALKELGVERIAYGPDGGEKLLRSHGPRVGLAFISFPHVAQELIPMVRARSPWATIAYDMVDAHGTRLARAAELGGDADAARAAEAIRRLELNCARLADLTIAISHEERQAMLELDPMLSVSVIGNAFKAAPLDGPPAADRSDVLFIGGFYHQPNVDAALWFVREIWPSIHASRPGITFRLVGPNAPPEVQALGNVPGVSVEGYVPDLEPFYQSARMSVAPLRFGAGVKGKIGHSLARGLPVVTTSIGAEGFKAEAGEHFLVADEADAFASEVLRLLTDDDLWAKLRASGHELIERTQSVELMRAEIERILDA